MKPSTKFKIKEAENCMDPPSNNYHFQDMLASMAEEIKPSKRKKKNKSSIESRVEESQVKMTQEDQSMKKEDWE